MPAKIFKNRGNIFNDNDCQFVGNLLFGLEERHVAGNPKQKDLRRVTAFFRGGKYWFNTKNRG